MPLRIFNNLNSLVAQRRLGENNRNLGITVTRIASGIRINRSSDDAAGLSISEGLRSDIRTLRQGARNLNDGLALIKVADGALDEQASILLRLRELASQAATGTIGNTERRTIQLEFNALRNEFDRIGATTEFNGNRLLDGSLKSNANSQVVIQIGVDSGSANRINLNREIDLSEISSSALRFNAVNIEGIDIAASALETLRNIINEINVKRGEVGVVQNRLERTLANTNVAIESLTTADSGIRDADLAEEVAALTKRQILVSTSAAMVGQANLQPQNVLQLL